MLPSLESISFARRIGSSVRLTTSQFLQTAEWLADVVKKEGNDLAAVLRQGPFREVLGHEKMDPRTKADQFFNAVKKTRFPGYEAYLEKFEKTRPLILREEKDLRIGPAAGFEDRGIDLQARVKTPEDLDRILQKLSENRPALNSLFDFML